MDHTISKIVFTSFSSHWTSIRAFFPEHMVSMMEFRFLPELGGGRWASGYVTDSKKLVGVSRDFILKPISYCKGEKGSNIAAGFSVEMSWEDISVKGVCKSAELYYSTPILGKLNWFARKLASAFAGNPIIYRFLSNAEFNLTANYGARKMKGLASQTYIQIRN